MRNKLKERITENGINYILVGDYYIPNLRLPEENRPIGRYGHIGMAELKAVMPFIFHGLDRFLNYRSDNETVTKLSFISAIMKLYLRERWYFLCWNCVMLRMILLLQMQ